MTTPAALRHPPRAGEAAWRQANALVLVDSGAHYVREDGVDVGDKSPSFQVRSM